jgi:hypothetical protein
LLARDEEEEVKKRPRIIIKNFSQSQIFHALICHVLTRTRDLPGNARIDSTGTCSWHYNAKTKETTIRNYRIEIAVKD